LFRIRPELKLLMPVHLEFNQSTSQFAETTKNTSNESIILTIDDAKKRLFMSVPSNITMIVRRAAERQARGITKTGFLIRTGARVGAGFELEVEGEGGKLPDRLTSSPREVY
jgi:hypothetical protein